MVDNTEEFEGLYEDMISDIFFDPTPKKVFKLPGDFTVTKADEHKEVATND